MDRIRGREVSNFVAGDCLLDRLSVIEDSRLGDLLLVVLVEAPRAEAVSPVARAVDGAAPFGAAREHVYLLAGSGRVLKDSAVTQRNHRYSDLLE